MVVEAPSVAGKRRLMEITKGYKAELDPNNVHRTHLLQHAGAARFAWNWGLARRKQEYEETGRSGNAIEQHRQLNALKPSEFLWMYEVSKCAMQESLRDLDKAYRNFFRRVKNGEKPGFPKFKSRKRGIGSFRLTGAIRVEENKVRLPRIGWLRLKEHGYILTEGIHILSATVSEKAGRWFVSVQCREEKAVTQAIGGAIGVDLGIKTMAVCSDGREFENPKALRKARRRLARLQRELARRRRGGQNWKKTKAKIAKLYYRIANIRKDALHKATSAICATAKPDGERPTLVAIEDLNVAGMTKNHCLAQAISDVGMGKFRRQMEYKTVWNGEELFVADRFFPSSRLCPICGCINSELKLSDRKWTCDCGAVHDRDQNAACNLRDLAIRTVSSAGTGLRAKACGEGVRLAAVSLASSVKQESTIESHGRF